MRKQQEVLLYGNLTAMIDVVFQIIIFFVCTISLQNAQRDANIHLALAPHGTPEGPKNPLQIEIQVSDRGRVSVANEPMSEDLLYAIIKKAANDYPGRVPVIIRADGKATHAMVRKAMDTAAAAGIMQIQITALIEAGSQKK
jgi:biopolymer transport protein ExbD